MKRSVLFLFLAVVCACTVTAHAQALRPEAGLTIVNAGPQGEVASLAEASEIAVMRESVTALLSFATTAAVGGAAGLLVAAVLAGGGWLRQAVLG